MSRAHSHARVAWLYTHPKPPGEWYVFGPKVLAHGLICRGGPSFRQQRWLLSLGTKGWPPRLDLRVRPKAGEPSFGRGRAPSLAQGWPENIAKLVFPDRLGVTSKVLGCVLVKTDRENRSAPVPNPQTGWKNGSAAGLPTWSKPSLAPPPQLASGSLVVLASPQPGFRV